MGYIRTFSIFLILILLSATPFAYAERGVEIKNKDDLSHKSGKLGTYRALVIGINNYQDKNIPALKTAVNDAKEFANLLETRYGFQITLLLDRQATKQAIMAKMRELAANTSPDESVLIYYAGHGDVDRVLNDGWWVPVDATGGDPVTYLDNNYVQRVMRGMKARHVLLVSDSCYSGTLFGESRSLPTLIDDRYYMNLYNEKSRWGMTSGNKTPVSDSGSEGHSIFAYQLIKALKKNDQPYITTQELYSRIAPIIANNSEQQPLCSPVRDTGDQGGGFVFVASTTTSFPTPEEKKQLAMVKRPSQPTSEETSHGQFINHYLEQDNNWKVRINITSLNKGERSGNIDFRSLNCGGYLNYVGKKDTGHLFKENLNYGRCVQGCYIWLNSDGTYYKEICNDNVTGSGNLRYAK